MERHPKGCASSRRKTSTLALTWLLIATRWSVTVIVPAWEIIKLGNDGNRAKRCVFQACFGADLADHVPFSGYILYLLSIYFDWTALSVSVRWTVALSRLGQLPVTRRPYETVLMSHTTFSISHPRQCFHFPWSPPWRRRLPQLSPPPHPFPTFI